MNMRNYFEGASIRLRALKPGDAEIVARHLQDSEISRRDSYIDWPQSLAEIGKQLEKQDQPGRKDDKALMIETLDGVLLGGVNIQLTDPHNGTFSIGIGLGDRSAWGKGYAKEAMQIILRYMFHERRYQKCNIGVYAFNQRALGLYRRLGFVEEGRLRRVYFTNGEYHDEILLGLTREEFDQHYPQYRAPLEE
jgi:RimJ/RimL family protein N-acetyltransferase